MNRAEAFALVNKLAGPISDSVKKSLAKRLLPEDEHSTIERMDMGALKLEVDPEKLPSLLLNASFAFTVTLVSEVLAELDCHDEKPH